MELVFSINAVKIVRKNPRKQKISGQSTTNIKEL